MADIRHAAAHRAMLLPTAMMRETAESQLTDDDVRARLRDEDPTFYQLMSPDMVAALEPLRIWLWRVDHYKTVAENVVVVKGRSGTYIRGAVVSIDYDLEMVEAVLDAFIVALFSVPAMPPSTG